MTNNEDDDVSKWTIADVENWLKNCGFERFVRLFCEDHEIDGEALLTLTENDLRTPPLQLTKLGDIKKLSTCLKQLQEKQRTISCDDINTANHQYLVPPPSSSTRRHRIRRHGNGVIPSGRRHQTSLYSDLSERENSSEGDSDSVYNEGVVNEARRRRVVFNPEYKKTILSIIYCIVVMFLTSFTMVVVHDRVPDKSKHPPLPDIFLDNIPLIPQAFVLAELCGIILMAIWICILIFHKHRFILLRRMYSIGSSVFLLRCITMFVTSLSVPGDHLQCTGARYSTMYARLERTFEICFGLGMKLSGLETCGDYMFSGHTVFLTMLNHLITEYTPVPMYSLHIVSWVLNLFGIFFILAAHEHYSIDVVIAFYISSRIFLYYHILANTRSYRHSKRIRIWFPLFSYFECNVPGKVPNEFEWPFSIQKLLNYCTKFKESVKGKSEKPNHCT